MADAYSREQQNNTRLDDLASKVSALRSVTVNIYDQAANHEVIDQSNELFSNLADNLKGSAGRLTRMAQQGNKVAILKLAGIIVAAVLVLYYAWRLILG